jgi:hypothetical protein
MNKPRARNVRKPIDLPVGPARAPLPKPKPKPKPVAPPPVYEPPPPVRYVAPPPPVVIKPRVLSEYTAPVLKRETPVMPELEVIVPMPLVTRIASTPGSRAWKIEQFVMTHFNISP